MKYLLFLAALLLTFPALAGDDIIKKSMEISGQGIDRLIADCSNGRMEIVGVAGLKKIEVDAEIDVSKVGRNPEEYIKDRVVFELEKRNSRAYLKVEINHNGWGRRQASIDLKVRVPQEIDLDIEHGSGSLAITSIRGNVYIEDGSGSLEVDNITGDLRIDDGSGSIDVADIEGEVEVDDGSGSISIVGIDGNVTIDDGSGGITVDGVEKDVLIKDSGSGGVSVNNVRGKFVKRD